MPLHELSQFSLFGIIAIGLTLEAFFPFRQVTNIPIKRWFNNLLLAFFNYAMLLLMGPFLYHFAHQLIGENGSGMLEKVGANTWGSFIALWVTLEFIAYWLHRYSHSNRWLWRLHAVHHSDTQQDVTTAERHHPLEVLLVACVNLPLLIFLGPDLEVLLIYNAVHVLITTLSHSNISLGSNVERLVGWFIVTPDFHRIHHLSDRQYTDSNYSPIFSTYDFIFGTASMCTREKQSSDNIGLEYFREPKYSRIDQMLVMPVRSDFSR